MGQESSSPVDESIPPQTLKDRTLGSVADFIRDRHAKNIVVMVGSLRSDKAGGFWADHSACFDDRLELVLARLLESQIFDHQIRGYTPT